MHPPGLFVINIAMKITLYKLKFLILIFFCVLNTSASADSLQSWLETGLTGYIMHHEPNCFWVQNVGDTMPASRINFKNTDNFCQNGEGLNNTKFSGLCMGTIACAGIPNIGTVYMEGIACPGAYESGGVQCGEKDISGMRGTTSGIISCLNQSMQGVQYETVDGGIKVNTPNEQREVRDPNGQGVVE